MMSVAQLMEEHLGRIWEGSRKEVGCQWESPQEERREVGCQSDSAERRDAAVQVDLLTQQLCWRHTGVCNMAWQCVSVRADGPGGGALLQHGSANTINANLRPTLRNPKLPEIHQCRTTAPPDNQELLSKDLQQTALLPSMSLLELPLLLPPDNSDAPPGFIAPLSPRLAEEEEEVGDSSGALKHDISYNSHGNRQYSATVKEKRKKWRRKWMSRGKPNGVKTQLCSRRTRIQTKQPETEGGVQKTRVKEQEEEGQQKQEGVTHVEIKQKLSERPRRKAVGPPIRYLIESETQSRGAMVEEGEQPRSRMKELSERTNSRPVESLTSGLVGQAVGGEKGQVLRKAVGRATASGQKLCQLRRAGHRLSCSCGRHLHHHLHSNRCRYRGRQAVATDTSTVDYRPEEEVNNNDKGEEEEEVEIQESNRTCLPATTEAPELGRHKERLGKKSQWLVDFLTTKSRGGRDIKGRWKWQENNGGRGGRRRRRRCREEEKGGAEAKQVCVRKENDEEVMEWTQRPRRLMVGPPIRYLLESEERSHGQIKAYHERAEGKKHENKGKSENGASNNTAILDRSEEADHRKRQKGWTNKDAENLPKCRAGRPKKVVTDSVIEGEASEDIYTSESAERQTDTEKLTGQTKTNGVRRNGRTQKKRRRPREEGVKLVCLEDKGDCSGKRGDRGGKKENKQEVMESPHRPRRLMIGPPIRYLLESEEQSPALVTTIQEREEEFKLDRKHKHKSNDEGWTSDNLAMIDSPMGTERQMHPNNEDGANETKETTTDERCEVKGGASKETGRETQSGTERQTGNRKTPNGVRIIGIIWRKRKRCREEGKEGKQVCVKEGHRRRSGGGHKADKDEEKKLMELPHRPRRLIVGPPIRYLLESEEQSPAPVTASQEREDVFRMDIKCQKKKKAEGTSNDSAVEGEEVKQVCVKEGQRRRSDGGHKADKDEEKKLMELPHRPRRLMVGPPIRYLLESEEQSPAPVTASQEREEVFRMDIKCQKKKKAEGTSNDSAVEGEEVKQVCVKEGQRRRGDGGHKADNDEEELMESPCRNRQTDTKIQTGNSKTNGDIRSGIILRKRKRCREEDEEVKLLCVKKRQTRRINGGGHEEDQEEEAMQLTHRPRRSKVGPPIRYILESEEWSHSWGTAYHERADDYGYLSETQRDTNAEVGTLSATPVIDRSEVTEQRRRQKDSTNKEGDRGRKGRPKKVVTDTMIGDGALEKIDTERQTPLMYADLQGGQVTVLPPCCVKLQRLL